MRLLPLCFFMAVMTAFAPCWSQDHRENLILVAGGSFKHPKSNFADRIRPVLDFYIGKYEVTQKEWLEVMGKNPSKSKGDNLPVESVSWYDCIEYCNKRSANEGLRPYYNIDKNNKDSGNRTALDDVKWTVTINSGANGYRLPTEMEWEYAACGGRLSKAYVYSGSDDIDKVAWFWQNSGDVHLEGLWNWPTLERNHNGTKPVGSKEPNELGLYDMSGNVREWCWDWHSELGVNGATSKSSGGDSGRVWKGGGWIGGDFCCEPSFRAGFEANGAGPDQGFRVCRSK